MRNENVAVNQAADTEPLTRRRFMGVAAMFAPGLCGIGPDGAALSDPTTKQANLDEHNLTEEIKKEKIRRAMLAGPSTVTAEAAVAEMDRQESDGASPRHQRVGLCSRRPKHCRKGGYGP
jgi:hypothetical protein